MGKIDMETVCYVMVVVFILSLFACAFMLTGKGKVKNEEEPPE